MEAAEIPKTIKTQLVETGRGDSHWSLLWDKQEGSKNCSSLLSFLAWFPTTALYP